MPKIKHIAFTLYAVKNMKRARAFYEKQLGLKITHDFGNVFVEYHLMNGCFALGCMKGLNPSSKEGGSIAFEVDNLDGFVAQLKKSGVKIKMKPISTPVCRMAVVIDSEGNALTLHQKKRGK